MIITLKIDDELYTHYAKRNPGNPRQALEEALAQLKDFEPGVPRLVVENPELRTLKSISGQILADSKELVSWAERSSRFSVGGVEVPLSMGQRQRIVQEAQAQAISLQDFLQRQVGRLIFQEFGG